jgi:RNA polymerase sigma factor (sigma-70 family)
MVNAPLHGVLRQLHRLRQTRALAEAPDAQLVEWFARRHEEEPFAALVRRHGPMVWAVARRLLAHVQDAEDIFQATFLLLARKADSVRKGGSVGSWLHGVAHRLALKARRQQARRRSRERRAADMRQARQRGETPWSEVQAALDAALGDLPEKYRAALVLCYLEGKTQQEAARQLGCPLATLRTRVARGRTLLRARLIKRGLTLSGAGVAALLIASAAPAAAPAALVRAAVQAALPFAAGQPAAALCSQQAAGLVEGGLRTMFLSKVKTATALLLAAGLVAGAAALAQRLTAAQITAKPPAATSARTPAAQAKPPAADDKDSIAYAGRVLGPDGRPIPGAKVYLTQARWAWRPSPVPECTTTGPDGRFRFTAPKAKYRGRETVVAATAPNRGPGWVKVAAGGKREDLMLRLAMDDVPITGQIVDLEGKPVAGATLRVVQINAAPGEDLGPWLEAAQAKKVVRSAGDLELRHLSRYTSALSPQVTTDAAGRFRLTGIGRNRLVRAQLDGPAIASQDLHILTRTGKTIEVTQTSGFPEGIPHTVTTYYGASFRHVAAPTKPIIGVVRDKDTKKPLAGVTTRSYMRAMTAGSFRPLAAEVSTTTDAEGRYRLTGLPKGEGYIVMIVPPGDRPYVKVLADVPDSPGQGPVTVDVELKRGVWVEGRITDKVTGKPVQGTAVYFALRSNPNLRDYPGLDYMPYDYVAANEDGSYRAVGLPGPGLVAVFYPKDLGTYLWAREREDEYGLKEADPETAPYQVLHWDNYRALARINPARGADAVKRDVTLDPGWTFTGTVLGPDGKPLAGARGFGLNGAVWDLEGMKTAAFTVRGFSPRRSWDVLFRHPEKGLVGVAQPPKDNGGSVTVRLEPGAAVTGRLVDAAGQPRAGVKLEVVYRLKEDLYWERVKTDRQGRFRIQALLPGYEFRLKGDRVEVPFGALPLGRTKDLGDVRMKRAEE